MSSGPRYGNQDLWLPKSFHTEFQKRLVDRSNVRAAFPRQVDLWWYALGIGVVEGQRTPLPDRDRLVKFNDGGILESDPWRTTHLELLALAEEGQTAATNASTVVQIANEYAITGCSVLTDSLRGVIDTQNHLIGLIQNGAA
ncbi:MAG: hypothetical protein OXG55_16705 [bacterium]|nr:hypothetical protein [bacterium]MCY4104878.1 hypothetical protein [bacterium]